MTMRMQTTAFFLLLALVGATLLWHSFAPDYVRSAGSVDAMMFFPRAILTIWIVLAVGAAVEEFARDGEPEQWAVGRLIVFMAIVVAYVALISRLGFFFASVPCAFLSLIVFGFRGYVLLPLAGLFLPLFVWALFTFVIQIGLPTSPWFTII